MSWCQSVPARACRQDTASDHLRATTAIISALFVAQSTAFTLPQSGQVSGGSAITASGATQLDINPTSNRAPFDWGRFNIRGGETVNFNQPDSSVMALNRIHDANPSRIKSLIEVYAHPEATTCIG